MEQREKVVFYHSFPDASEREIEVAEILVKLPDMISEFESPRWGFRKKRSAIAVRDDTNKPSTSVPQLSTSHWSLLKRCLPISGSSLAMPPPLQAIKGETQSPDTPLSFDRSESDEKPDSLMTRTVLGKRKGEEWNEIIKLTAQKESLEIELQNVERYYEKLNDFNLKLKARKVELMRLGHKEEEAKSLETEASLNPVVQLCRPTVTVASPSPAANQQLIQISPNPGMMPFQHHLQLIIDQTAQTQRREIKHNLHLGYGGYPSSSSSSSSGGNVSVVYCNNNNVGPRGLPDLNFCFEDAVVLGSSQPYDLDRMRAAQARQKRLDICRVRKPQRLLTKTSRKKGNLGSSPLSSNT